MSNEDTQASSAATKPSLTLDDILFAHNEAFPEEKVKWIELEDQSEHGRTVFTIRSVKDGENQTRTWQVPLGVQDARQEMLTAFKETPVS
jgi:uncharacterized iron-regulated membrane protein